AGQVSALKDQPGLTPDLADRVDRLEHSTQQALKVVRNFLNFARKTDCGRTLVHLNSLIQQMVELLSCERRTHDIEVLQRLGEIPSVMADAGEIQQVLLNRLKN